MLGRTEIEALIPHREPFLWIDRVLSLSETRIEAEKDIGADLPVFRGHYPHFPIMPGVLLCEALFQAGALLIAHRLRQDGETKAGVPVLTRIGVAKFKLPVGPGDTVRLEARLSERLADAWFLKGKVLVNGKTAVKVDFACALADLKTPDSC